MRVAYVRKKYAIDPPDKATRDEDILTLAQATQYSGVSDTTLRKLIQENILAAEQIAPYAPLEIKRTDLDSEAVIGILMPLKANGKLVLAGVPWSISRARSLRINSLHNGGIMSAFSDSAHFRSAESR